MCRLGRKEEVHPLIVKLVRCSRERLQRLGSEEGIALVVVIGMIVVLTIMTIAIIDSATANEHSAGREAAGLRAFDNAETGINHAMSLLTSVDKNNTQPLSPASDFSQTETFDAATNSTVTYSGVKGTENDGSGNPHNYWQITSRGTFGASARGVGLRLGLRTVTSDIETPPSPAWSKGVFAAGTASCNPSTGVGGALTVTNNLTLTTPIYLQGDLCMYGGNILNPTSGSPISIYVGGAIWNGRGGTIGTTGSKLVKVTAVRLCHYDLNPTAYNCGQHTTPNMKVYADTYSPTPDIPLPKPPLYADTWYRDAKPGPRYSCTSGSVPWKTGADNGFDDNNATRDTSVYGNDTVPGSSPVLRAVNFIKAGMASYDCQYVDGTTVVGRIAFNSATKQLTVNGTIYIDGNVSFAGTDTATYTGMATIYVDGIVSMSRGSRLCASPSPYSSCSTTGWDPTHNSLLLVAVNHQNKPISFDMVGDSQFMGSAYVVGKFSAGASAKLWGPLITDSATINGDMNFLNWPGNAVPPNAPDPIETRTETVFDREAWIELPIPNG